MTGFGYGNVDYAVAKEAAALFQDVYPERLVYVYTILSFFNM